MEPLRNGLHRPERAGAAGRGARRGCRQRGQRAPGQGREEGSSYRRVLVKEWPGQAWRRG